MRIHGRKLAVVAAAVAAVVGLTAAPAFAGICVNASKKPLAGAQVVFDENDDIVHITNGLAKRVEKGLIDPDTGEGFHGIIGFTEGDLALSTFIVTPNQEIPERAQLNGPPCKGITNFDRYFANCLE